MISPQEYIKRVFPWLVAEWNGVEWEAERTLIRRRLNALEINVRSQALRINDLETQLLDHAQGRQHAPAKPKLPPPDQEG